jgi:phytoene dehydrogenase-like protein
MADRTYDAIVVGGGHQGTIIACYLQHAGMSTVVFERQHELGGGACGEALPLPGFLQNPCAHWTRFYGHPAYQDFELREKGLAYVYPEHSEGMIYDDGSAFMGLTAWRVVDPVTGRSEFDEKNAQYTIDQIARFSKRDADAAYDLLEKYRTKWRAAFHEWRYNPPTPWGVPDAFERLFDDPDAPIPREYQFYTSQQVAYDLFESDYLRTLFMRSCMTSSGVFPNDCIGVYKTLHTLGLILSWEPASIAIGGTHAITHALQRAFSSMGGEFVVETPVKRAIIENGTAVGVELYDGRQIAARKVVVSDLNTGQTILNLIGEEHVPAKIAHRAKNVLKDRAQLFWGNFALHELPQYTAAADVPDIGMCPRLNWGPKDPDYFATRHQAELFVKGIPDKLVAIVAPDSIWDKTRAAQGKHTILIEQFTAPYRFFSDREWLRMKADIVEIMREQWSWYAPNMTKDNVIATHITTPMDVQMRNINMPQGGWTGEDMIASQMGRMRPFPELAHYRMPIKSLYLASAAAHSGPGIGRGSAYNCFKVIAEDYGLPKIWEQKGRAY